MWLLRFTPSYLVLKLNAFDDRQMPKDAYDVLLSVTHYKEGVEKAIEGFLAEAKAENPCYGRARSALQRHFSEPGQSGPARCAEFVLKGRASGDELRERRTQLTEQMVTVGRALLGE